MITAKIVLAEELNITNVLVAEKALDLWSQQLDILRATFRIGLFFRISTSSTTAKKTNDAQNNNN